MESTKYRTESMIYAEETLPNDSGESLADVLKTALTNLPASDRAHLYSLSFGG